MVQVSNPGKVMFPGEGYTKADVVDHYRRVAERMLAHVAGRPLTLHRFPGGIAGKGFLQKNAGKHFPASIQRVEIPKREGGVTNYPVVVELGDIPYLANQGTVTFHVWTSRLPDLHTPDRVVFDLDPPRGDAAGAQAAARLVGSFLDDIGLPSVPMTTGSNGYHLVTPVAPDVEFAAVAEWARTAAALLAHLHPDVLSDEFRKEKRRGRVFVDWLRNRYGSTGVVAWSLRARPGAPVAVPFAWDELADTPPRRWTIGDVPDLLTGRDPILEAAPADLAPAIAAVYAAADDAAIVLEPFDRFRS